MTRLFVPCGAGGGIYIIPVNALVWTQVFDDATIAGPYDVTIFAFRPVFSSKILGGTQSRRLVHALDGVTWTKVDADLGGLACGDAGATGSHYNLVVAGATLRVSCGGGGGFQSRVRDTGDLVTFATHNGADYGAVAAIGDLVAADASAQLYANIALTNGDAFFKNTGAWTAQAAIPTGVGVTVRCIVGAFSTIFAGKDDGSLHRYNSANNTWVSVVAAGGFGAGVGIKRMAWMPSLGALFICTDSATAAQRIFSLLDPSGTPAPASIAGIDGSIGAGNSVADVIVVPSSPAQLYVICSGGAAAPILRSADGVTVAANLGATPNATNWANNQVRMVYNPFDTRFYLGGQTGGVTARIYRSAVPS